MKFCLIKWAVYRLKVNGKRTKKENADYRKSSALPVCFPFHSDFTPVVLNYSIRTAIW